MSFICTEKMQRELEARTERNGYPNVSALIRRYIVEGFKADYQHFDPDYFEPTYMKPMKTPPNRRKALERVQKTSKQRGIELVEGGKEEGKENEAVAPIMPPKMRPHIKLPLPIKKDGDGNRLPNSFTIPNFDGNNQFGGGPIQI